MKFTELELKGAFLIELTPFTDDRGGFARTYCTDEFRAHGINPVVVQCNLSRNTRKGTLRPMHWKDEPKGEAKLVRASRGSIYDVIVDVRPDSPTYLRHAGFELSADNDRMLYIPVGFAHGFLTLEDNTDVFYQMSNFYSPDHARGARYNDPAFAIDWPDAPEIISEKDLAYPDFKQDAAP